MKKKTEAIVAKVAAVATVALGVTAFVAPPIAGAIIVTAAASTPILAVIDNKKKKKKIAP